MTQMSAWSENCQPQETGSKGKGSDCRFIKSRFASLEMIIQLSHVSPRIQRAVTVTSEKKLNAFK
jgi:hypothetical protein